MESKELIQSYLHAKSLIFYMQPFEKSMGGGGGIRMTPPWLICYSK